MGTGGGPLIISKFDDTDTKVLDLISPKATFGDFVPVPNVTFDFGNGLELNLDHNLSVYPSRIKNEEKIKAAKPSNEPQVEDSNNDNNLLNNNEEPTIIVPPPPAENNNNPNTTPKNTNKLSQRSRFTKTKRLEMSTSISNSLVKIEDEKKSAVAAYYQEKIKYTNWRKTYEKRKPLLLKNKNKIHLEIIKELHNR